MILTFEATIRGGLPVEVDATVWWSEDNIHSAITDVRFPRRRGKNGSEVPEHLISCRDEERLEEEAIDAYLAGKD